MVEVIPAIIPGSLAEIEEKISLVKGLVPKIQIDFVDGKYAPPTTWPFNLEKEQEIPKLNFAEEVVLEADLMIKHPEDFIEDFVSIGFKSFVVHVDSTKEINRCVHLIREANCKVGLAIKPKEENKVLYEFLEKIDFVQFMGNDRVGYNGVELDRNVLKKISDFHSGFPFLPIQIDIGVNEKTARELTQVGVTGLVSGSAVFKDSRIKENIEKLRNL